MTNNLFSYLVGRLLAILREARSNPVLAGSVILLALFVLFGGLSISLAVIWLLVLAATAFFWPKGMASQSESGDRARFDPGHDPASGTSTWPAILGGMHDLALLLDRNSNLVAFNDRADAPQGSFIGRHISHWKRAPVLLRSIDEALAKGEQRTCELREE
ncbi:MAG: hypothetical protein F9K44_14455, partial [Hyphomicrobiaceae bacterium]